MNLMKTLMVYLLLMTAGAANSTIDALPVLPTLAPAETPIMTSAPTMSAAPTNIYTALSPGSRGDMVLQMQTRLQELGYLTGGLDGIYGRNTQKAVEQFQEDHHLSVDGVAGQATLSALFEPEPEPLPTQTPAPALTPSAAPTEVPSAAPTETPSAAPTETPAAAKETTAAPQAASSPVSVRVEYIDQQTGAVLYQTEIQTEASTTVYADNKNLQGAYRLCSPGAVTVTVKNGAAYPASVIFHYIPDTVVYTVLCKDEAGTVLHTETVTVSRGSEAVITPDWNAVREGWHVMGESSASVTAETEGAAPPEPIVFTYQRLSALAPDDSLLPEGTAVSLGTAVYPLPWYVNHEGTPFICLNHLAQAAAWPVQNQRYAVNGQEVTFVMDGNKLISLTVQDASFAENAHLWEGRLYVDKAFLQALGFTVWQDGSTLHLNEAE